MQNETKDQDLDFQRSITFLMPKIKELHFLLVSVKQLLFLQHFQTIDARLQILCHFLDCDFVL